MTNEYENLQLQHKLQKHAKEYLSYGQRVMLRNLLKCRRQPLYRTDGVGVEVSETDKGEKKVSYLGLMHCRSTWACPVCSGHALREKRIELDAIIEAMQKKGHAAVMVTFTVPHNRRQSAAEVIELLTATQNKYLYRYAHYMRQNFAKDGRLWCFTSTECKYNGLNGWHFHNHVLYFIDEAKAKNFMTDETQTQLFKYWKEAMKKVSPEAAEKISETTGAVYISRHTFDNADYLVKEMLKATNKTKVSRAPLELLADESPSEVAKYYEFALATRFHRRFTQTPKLRKYCGLTKADLKKKATATQNIAKREMVCWFTYDSYLEIIHNEDNSGEFHRLNILRAAVAGGYDGVLFYCQKHALPEPLRWRRGDFKKYEVCEETA